MSISFLDFHILYMQYIFALLPVLSILKYVMFVCDLMSNSISFTGCVPLLLLKHMTKLI